MRIRKRTDKTRLEQLREEKGYTQARLADLSQISPVAVSKYERRERSIDRAGIDILVLLAKALGVGVYDLLENKGLREAVRDNYKRHGGGR